MSTQAKPKSVEDLDAIRASLIEGLSVGAQITESGKAKIIPLGRLRLWATLDVSEQEARWAQWKAYS